MLLLLASLILLINAAQYCPSVNDLVVSYGESQVTLKNQGWKLSGGGGAATAASFNILGGQVDFDIDFSNSKLGANGNIYTISPNPFTGKFNKNLYCDGQGSPYWCEEIDWIESNGNCGAATTLHTLPGQGGGSCNAWGCSTSYNYNGRPTFHMTISYALDGTMTVFRDGIIIRQTDMSPLPTPNDSTIQKTALQNKGAVIYSSLWEGWVPTIPGCGNGGGQLSSSSIEISNLQISGNVVSGPVPTLCASQAPLASPPAVPPVAPQPPPVAAPTAPTAPVSTTPAGTCQISGSNNNYYYTEVRSVVGASVTINCNGPAGNYPCTLSTWGDNSYFQCALGQGCNNPTPVCTLPGSTPPPVAPPPTTGAPPPVAPPPTTGAPPPTTGAPPPVAPPPTTGVPPPVAPPPTTGVPPPVAPPPTTGTPPPTSSGSPSSTCSFTGSSNNPYYYEIRSVNGASVSVTCGSGQGSTCAQTSWDNTLFQCWPQNCQSASPHCSVSAPPPQAPSTSGGSAVCRLEGNNNGAYYQEVRATVGASVTITCSSGTGTTCQLANWDNTYFQCWTQNCQNPTPHCSGGGNRMEDDSSSSGSSFPGWGIGVIVAGVVLLIASIFLGVILYHLYQKNQKPTEV